MTAPTKLDNQQRALTQHRYDRIAPIYDAVEWLMEIRAHRWRRDLWSRVAPGRVLELGVGTGKNLPFYPERCEIVAVDISERMLARARKKARRVGVQVRLELADVQHLPYADATFDVVIATFLFCSVLDPALGLAEARRVLKRRGRLLLVEHVLSGRPALRSLMRWLDPIPFHLWGAHINRETVRTVRAAGFVDLVETNLSLDVVRRIEAAAPDPSRMLQVCS